MTGIEGGRKIQALGERRCRREAKRRRDRIKSETIEDTRRRKTTEAKKMARR